MPMQRAMRFDGCCVLLKPNEMDTTSWSNITGRKLRKWVPDPSRKPFHVCIGPPFAEYGTQALWNMRPIEDPTPADALAATKGLADPWRQGRAAPGRTDRKALPCCSVSCNPMCCACWRQSAASIAISRAHRGYACLRNLTGQWELTSQVSAFASLADP